MRQICVRTYHDNHCFHTGHSKKICQRKGDGVCGLCQPLSQKQNGLIYLVSLTECVQIILYENVGGGWWIIRGHFPSHCGYHERENTDSTEVILHEQRFKEMKNKLQRWWLYC